jgi:AcrR family transcriptional regulator
MTTRDRILDTALELFNEGGTAAVSTNHIAAALGISPGNLYYHFRNKEEIIRALFERLFAGWDEMFELDEGQLPTLDDLLRLLRANFGVMWRFRFAHRELVVLLRRDEILRARWLEVRERGYVGFRELMGIFVAAGVVHFPTDPATVERLADLCWLISEFWLASLEVSGQPVNAAQQERAVALMLQVLVPALTVPPAPTNELSPAPLDE